MNLYCSIAHWSATCFIIFTMLTAKDVEADVFHYFKLKKLLTAVTVAKALSHRKTTLLPVPIPIPIPIQQNEIISLPSSVAKKMIYSGGGHSKQPVKTIIVNGGSMGSSVHGSSSYGYGLSNMGRLSTASSNKRFFRLGKLLNLPGLSRANSVKVIHVDPLSDVGGLGNQFPMGMNNLGSGNAITGSNNHFFMDSNNVLDGKLLMGSGSQFLNDGGGYGIGSGGLSFGDNQFYGNGLPLSSLHNGMGGDSFLNNYNSAPKQGFTYPQGFQQPYKRRRRRNKRKNNPYQQRRTTPRPHMVQNLVDNQKRPPPPPSTRPLPPPQSFEADATITIDVGDKWNPLHQM